MQKAILMIIAIPLLLFAAACAGKEKERLVLFEMKNFDGELQCCVHNSLHDKWVGFQDDSLVVHANPGLFSGRKTLFKDVTGMEPHPVKYGTRKLVFSLSCHQADSTVYNVQQFLFESTGAWRRVLNMGNFTVTGEMAGETGICRLMVKTGMAALYK